MRVWVWCVCVCLRREGGRGEGEGGLFFADVHAHMPTRTQTHTRSLSLSPPPLDPAQTGHVDECLGGFGHGALDKPTGRMMGDTTTLFILELYEILQHTADIAFVKKMWPSAKNALEWCMGNANKNGYVCDNSVPPSHPRCRHLCLFRASSRPR